MKAVLGSRTLFYSVMALLTAIYGLPLLWMLASTFKENREIFSTPLALPTTIDFSSWAKAWEIGNIGRYAFNSAFVTSSSVFVILLFASLAAFGFSRFRFPGKKGFLVVFGIGLLMPLQSYFIAQNLLFEVLSLKGHRWTLIIPYAAMGLPLAIYLLKVYLDSLPGDLFDAARIDGCGETRIFTSIVVPLLRPGLATVGIFSALQAWNEFLLAFIYVTEDAHKTIPTGLVAFSSRYVTDYQLLFSALAIVVLPMIAIYALFHRQIVAGITDGSLR